MRPRYKLFRSHGVFSIFWLPLALFETDALTYIAEKVAIGVEDPEVNRTELATWSAEVGRGQRMWERRKARRRPYAWRRRKAREHDQSSESIWSLPVVVAQLAGDSKATLDQEQVFSLQLPYSKL